MKRLLALFLSLVLMLGAVVPAYATGDGNFDGGGGGMGSGTPPSKLPSPVAYAGTATPNMSTRESKSARSRFMDTSFRSLWKKKRRSHF